MHNLFFKFKNKYSIDFSLIFVSIFIQIIFLFLLPISIEADGAGYYLYARIFQFRPDSWFMWWRPPGYSLYLHILGVTWLNTFYIAIFVNSCLGVLMPYLVYLIFKPISKLYGLMSASILILSTICFSYSKVFTNDHLYSFLLLLTAFYYSRFLYSNLSNYLILSFLAILCATMVRWEAMYIGIFMFVMSFFLIINKNKEKKNIFAFLISISIFITSLCAWSGIRAVVLGKSELFGSLHNAGGRQLFWRVYSIASREAPLWNFSRPADNDKSKWSKDKKSVIFVREENGDASRKISSMFPGALDNPTDSYASTIVFGEEINKIGILEGDKVLAKAVKETFLANPELFRLIALSITPYFGISFPDKIYFNWNVYDTYEAMPYDIGKTVVLHLPKDLLRQYKDSQWQIEDQDLALSKPVWKQEGRSEFLNKFHKLTHELRNFIRNATGFILIFTLPLLLVGKHKKFGVFFFISLSLMLAASALGFGYNGRYEHFIFPFILILTTLSVKSLFEFIYRLRNKII